MSITVTIRSDLKLLGAIAQERFESFHVKLQLKSLRKMPRFVLVLLLFRREFLCVLLTKKHS